MKIIVSYRISTEGPGLKPCLKMTKSFRNFVHCIIYSVVPPPGTGVGNRSAWSDCGSTRGGPVTAATSAAAVRGHNTTAPILGHPRPGLVTNAIIFWLLKKPWTPFPRIRFFLQLDAKLETRPQSEAWLCKFERH